MHLIDTIRRHPSTLTEYEGRDYGAGTSLILVNTSKDGDGPALHRHPYSETFIIVAGQALFTVGDRTLTGSAGQIVIVPPNTPHKFAKTGDQPLQMVDVHASDHFITEWL